MITQKCFDKKGISRQHYLTLENKGFTDILVVFCAEVRKDIDVDFLGCDAMFCLGSMLFVPKDDLKLLKKPYYNHFLYHNIS